MKRIMQMSAAIGLAALMLLMALALTGAPAASASDGIDLALTLAAPQHVMADADYVVNLKYENVGALPAPDGSITAILPGGAQFVTATDRSGAPLPPDVIDVQTLTWNVGPLAPADCCRHIFITLHTAAALTEGARLTLTASIATTASEADVTNNAAEVVSTICDMAGSSKQVHAPEALPGDVLTYTLQLRYPQRAGEPNQRWVDLTDTLPVSRLVRFLGWNGELTGTQYTSQALLWQGRLRAGEPLSLQYRLGVELDVPPGTIITNGAQLRWNKGELHLGPVTTVVTLPQYARLLGVNGGQWQHQYGVDLDVPPQAVTDTTRFQFRAMSNTEIISGPPGLMWAHRAFELTAFRFGDVRQFARPLTITVHYSGTDAAGLNQQTLRLWYRNGPGEPWAQLGEPARVMSGSLSFTTTHLTQFALFGEGAFQLHLPLLNRHD